MSTVKKNIKRVFKSPTHIRVIRPYYAIPLLVAFCAVAVLGDKTFLARRTPASPSAGHAQVALNDNVSRVSQTTTSNPSASASTSSNTTAAKPATSSSNSQPGSNPTNSSVKPAGLITPVVNQINDLCSSLVNGLMSTYYATVNASNDLLTLQLNGLLGDIGALFQKNKDIDAYNGSVQSAYNQASQSAQIHNCSLPITGPSLKLHDN